MKSTAVRKSLPLAGFIAGHLPEEGEEVIGPPLKWAGGKRWLVPSLSNIFATHRKRRFVEPFVGGMAVALGLRPPKALLGDVNPHLINFYTWLQRGLVVEDAFENDKEYFYLARARFNRLIAEGQALTQQAAALFYYLNRTGFNGLCRFNSKGFFNVPFGRYKTISYQRDFTRYQKVLAPFELYCGGFEHIALHRDDFLYVDPPYDVEFTHYAKDDFSWDDQVRLVEWLTGHPGPIVASNQATPRIMKLYREAGFSLELIEAPRRISCTGDRSPATEILAYKNL